MRISASEPGCSELKADDGDVSGYSVVSVDRGELGEAETPYRPPRSTERSPRYIPRAGSDGLLGDALVVLIGGTGGDIPISRIDLTERDCDLGLLLLSSSFRFTLVLLLIKLIRLISPSPFSRLAASSLALTFPESYDPSPRRVFPRDMPAEVG